MDNKAIDKKIATDIMKWKDLEFLGFWSPSTNIAHAFEVEAKVFKLKYTLEICRKADGGFIVFGYNRHDRSPIDKPVFSAQAGTPAMAISLAALETIKDS